MPSDSRNRHRELYESMPVMYFEMDQHGEILAVNAFGADELGYKPSELVGRSVLEVFHEEDRERVAEQLRSLTAGGQAVASWEFRKRRKNGSVLWVRESARAVPRDPEGMLVMVVCQDVTQRKRAEEESREAARLVRELSLQLDEAQERERRRIAVHLHDDVGQTLALAQIKLAQLRSPAGAERALVEEVRGLLQRATEETRSLTFELASPVLYELGLVEALRSLCDRSQAGSTTGFAFHCAPGLVEPPERVAVPLYRIASELAFNVRKHAGAREASIALERRGDALYLRVEDDGRGFDAELARSPVEGSRGVGLFHIARHVELLGGSLDVRTGPGGGTVITVCCELEPADG